MSQFSPVTQSCLTLCGPMNHSSPGLPVHHQLPEFTQTHAHQVGDAIQPSNPLESPSPSAPSSSQHQGLFNVSTLRMRWPKFWSFSFSISPSNEHPNKCLPHSNSPTAKWKQTLLPNHQALLLLKIYSARNTHIAQKYTNWISLPQCDQERAQTGPKHTFRPFLGAAEDQE